MRGLDDTDAGLVILSEPDGPFSGHDVTKLLAYSDDVRLAVAELQAKQKMDADSLSAFMQKMDHTLKLIMQDQDHAHEAAMGAASDRAELRNLGAAMAFQY